ncbi:hypothetical protein [Haloarcula onubensis]|uniref:Uncharacterized protein n=1 Tax=Haloarcula onubensis TaxID=2950539 RepID=A0ABU2FND2_9EURY|nr:hypothetical protein [Halomicroarcula sp. S3CR25-11]MDS0282267.1 hypothetical protein [Halomicroarcula sp. S3CR25-11]
MTWDESRTAKMLQAAEKRLSQASEGAVLVGAAESLAGRLEALVRNSRCYRWLTAEPNPDVIVIDLRETYTVGPFIGLLETVARPVERAWSNSGLESAAATAGTTMSGSRIGQLLSAFLEPPESPERER